MRPGVAGDPVMTYWHNFNYGIDFDQIIYSEDKVRCIILTPCLNGTSAVIESLTVFISEEKTDCENSIL